MRAPASLVLIAVALAPVATSANGLEALPLAADLRQAPVGAWAKYLVQNPVMARFELLVTLIARDRTSATLELTLAHYPSEAVPMWTVQTVAPLDRGARVNGRRVYQAGNYDPMLLPPIGSKDDRDGTLFPLSFARSRPRGVNRRQVVVEVPGGSFATSHVHSRDASQTTDLWTSATVFPLGVVQLQVVPVLKGITVRGPFSGEATRHRYESMEETDFRVEAWQLLAQGTGGKSRITKRPVPYDAEALRNQIMETMIKGASSAR